MGEVIFATFGKRDLALVRGPLWADKDFIKSNPDMVKKARILFAQMRRDITEYVRAAEMRWGDDEGNGIIIDLYDLFVELRFYEDHNRMLASPESASRLLVLIEKRLAAAEL